MYQTFYTTAMCQQKKVLKKRFQAIQHAKRRKTAAILSGIVIMVLIILSSLLACGFTNSALTGNQENTIIYTNENPPSGYSMRIPQGWEGKYVVEEEGNTLYVVHKGTREAYPDAGVIFYIEKVENGSMTQEEILEPGNRAIVAEEDGYTYVFGRPTDVQYPIWTDGDVERNKALSEEYLLLCEDLDGIQKSFRLTAV